MTVVSISETIRAISFVIAVVTCCQNCARRYILSFLKSQSIECIACTSASGAAGRLAAPVGCIRTSAPRSLPAHNDPSPSRRAYAWFKHRTSHFHTNRHTFSKLSRLPVSMFEFWIVLFIRSRAVSLFTVSFLLCCAWRPETEKRNIERGSFISIPLWTGRQSASGVFVSKLIWLCSMLRADIAKKKRKKKKRKLTGRCKGVVGSRARTLRRP